jgi:undecaprenyl-diphosphatase
MRTVTLLGSKAVVLPVLVVAGVLVCRARRSWRPAIAIVVVFGAAEVARAVVAELVHRPRPPAADFLTGAGGWSYPSGHTIQGTVACGILLVLLAPGRARRTQVLLAAGSVLVVLGVAVSRVYLGVHWLTDVLGSMTLGIAVLALWGVARVAASSWWDQGASDGVRVTGQTSAEAGR